MFTFEVLNSRVLWVDFLIRIGVDLIALYKSTVQERIDNSEKF